MKLKESETVNEILGIPVEFTERIKAAIDKHLGNKGGIKKLFEEVVSECERAPYFVSSNEVYLLIGMYLGARLFKYQSNNGFIDWLTNIETRRPAPDDPTIQFANRFHGSAGFQTMEYRGNHFVEPLDTVSTTATGTAGSTTLTNEQLSQEYDRMLRQEREQQENQTRWSRYNGFNGLQDMVTETSTMVPVTPQPPRRPDPIPGSNILDRARRRIMRGR